MPDDNGDGGRYRSLSAVRPRFDPVINWGHVLIAATLTLGGIAAFYDVKADYRSLDYRVAGVERSSQAITAAIERLTERSVVDASQNERLNSLDRRVDGNERRIDRLEGRGNLERRPAQ